MANTVILNGKYYLQIASRKVIESHDAGKNVVALDAYRNLRKAGVLVGDDSVEEDIVQLKDFFGVLELEA